MATMFYSLFGEGRGHATLVCAIVEDLRKFHQIVITHLDKPTNC